MGIPFKGWERFLFHNSHMHECMGGVWFVFSSFVSSLCTAREKILPVPLCLCVLSRALKGKSLVTIKYSARIIKLVAGPTLPLFYVSIQNVCKRTYTLRAIRGNF